jgi:hypothetical protein
MAENKTHWYDGWFYDLLIAPNQDKLFQQIKNIIEPNKNIIDVGCGTGRFSLYPILFNQLILVHEFYTYVLSLLLFQALQLLRNI